MYPISMLVLVQLSVGKKNKKKNVVTHDFFPLLLFNILLSFLFAAQYKEAKETLTKTRRELTRTKTIKKKLVNNALTWGRLAHNGGKFNQNMIFNH